MKRKNKENGLVVGYNFIFNQWLPESVGGTFQSLNPADTRDIIGFFPRSSKGSVDVAVAAAKEAYPKWRLVPAPKRGEILFRTAQILKERKEKLAVLMTREMGKNLAESRGDIQEAIDMCEFIGGEGRRLYGKTTTSELGNKFAMSVRASIGVCALITPWNFPVAIPSWKIAPALICGNTVVFKPAEDTPACAQAFVEILLEAGLKDYPGVLNLIHGYGEEAGAALVEHPDVALVSFTGSSEVGRIVNIKCAEQYKRVSLEMGGKNCTIVMDDADLDLAVKSCHWGAFGTAGQRCTASSRLIVHKAILNEFIREFAERTVATKVGNGLEAGVEIGPLINKAAQKKVLDYVLMGLREGAGLICGGHALNKGEYANGHFFEPTVFLAENPKMRINQEEIFGPVASIIPVENFDEAIKVANSVNYGLSTAIITSDINKAMIAMRDLESGITYINSSTIGAEVHLPFGGVKQTGNGHREGDGALDIFSEWKTVYVDFSGNLQKAQIDN